MKKLLILCLYVGFFFSCGTETDEESPDFLTLALEEISNNQQLLDKVYEETAKRVTSDTIQYFKDKATSLDEFILYMSRVTDHLFEEIVKNQDAGAADVFIKIPTVPGETKHAALLKLLELQDPFTGYANMIVNDAEQVSKEKDTWIIMEDYEDANRMHHSFDEASVSVNYEQIIAMIEMQDILISSVMSEEEQEEAIEELVVKARIPEVLMGLLLPAVQHYTDAPSSDPFMNWLNTEINPKINGGLNRDLIRRKAFMSFLGGLDLFVNENYNNDNQESASINLMQARYETMLMSIWAEIWNQ